MTKFDLTIIGGGIVGSAIARQISIRHPKLTLCLLEKEEHLAQHQSKRNSGVLHCGIYYKKGSLKSKFCKLGSRQAKEYCLNKGLPYKQCGKLIVATNDLELERLHSLYANAKNNDIQGIEMLNQDQIQTIQPGCDAAKEAIWSPNTAIVDWHQVTLSYAEDFVSNGGKIKTRFLASRLTPSDNGTIMVADLNTGETIETKTLVNCAGLFSDYFIRQTGNRPDPMVVPIKGDYYLLRDKIANSIKTNIYPVPDPQMPFLGVHITPKLDGSVLVGPTARPVLSYENYSDNPIINIAQLYSIVFKTGLRNMIKNKAYRRAYLNESIRRQVKPILTKEVQALLPEIRGPDLIDSLFSGIRAQAVTRKGRLVDDFMFETGVYAEFRRVLHLRNCPSPAATSSLAIASRVVDILEERLI